MGLSQHSARCPVALRTFLDCNLEYWCFIPMSWYDAEQQNIAHMQETSGKDPQMAYIIRMGAINNQRVSRCLDGVPLALAVYAFSHRQQQKQRLSFEQFISLPYGERPYSTVGLYKHAIIGVLPDRTPLIRRYIIKQFFVIHGQTKLNMIYSIGVDLEKRYDRPYDPVWCAGLNS